MTAGPCCSPSARRSATKASPSLLREPVLRPGPPLFPARNRPLCGSRPSLVLMVMISFITSIYRTICAVANLGVRKTTSCTCCTSCMHGAALLVRVADQDAEELGSGCRKGRKCRKVLDEDPSCTYCIFYMTRRSQTYDDLIAALDRGDEALAANRRLSSDQ